MRFWQKLMFQMKSAFSPMGRHIAKINLEYLDSSKINKMEN